MFALAVLLKIATSHDVLDFDFLGLAHADGYYFWDKSYTVTNHSTWIGDSMSVIGDKTLKEITLPGTHDSGAFNLTASIIVPGEANELEAKIIEIAEYVGIPAEYLITVWALAQDQDFYSQMVGGIRYFDLRCGWDNDTQTWRTFHMEFGHPLENLLSDLNRFMTEFPSEIVVVEASHQDGAPTIDDDTELADLLIHYLGDFIYPRGESLDLNISQMVA